MAEEYQSIRIGSVNVGVSNFNDDFLLIRLDEPLASPDAYLFHLGKALFDSAFSFIDEVVASESEICLKLNKNFNKTQLKLIEGLSIDEAVVTRSIYRLPVCFDLGTDWEAVEQYSEGGRGDAIRDICQREFALSMLGFLPGFLYLGGLPEYLQVPRKAVPSTRVEPNSIAIGGKYLGLYSLESPGGWHVIGKTPASVLKLSGLPPVSLTAADRLLFRAIGRQEYERLCERQLPLEAFRVGGR